MKGKVWLKLVVVGLVVMGLVFLGVACRPAPAVEEVTPAPTEEMTPPPAEEEAPPAEAAITIWHGWQGEYLANIERVFQDYMAEHPNVKIELINVPDLVEKLTTAVPGGEGPDIFAWVHDNIGRLAELGVTVPLDPYIDKAWFEETYLPVATQAMMYKDQIWALPESIEAITLIYNKALIGEEDLPKDTDDLLSKADEWNATHPGNYYFVYNAKNDAYFAAPWFYGYGAYYVKEDGSVGLDTPEGLAAATLVSNLRKVMPEEIDYGVAMTLFQEGKAAILMNGPWSIADIEAAGVDYGMALLPVISATGQPAKPFVGVKCLWITPNSKNPEVALDVIKFYTSKEAQVHLAKTNKMVPTNKAAAEDPEVMAIPTVSHFVKQAELGTPMPNTPFMSGMWDPVGKMLEAIWTGTNPADAVKIAQQAAETNVEGMK